jgi:lipoyl(octanoyl) transferase
MHIEIKISKTLITYEYAMKFMEKRVLDVKNNKKKELLWILEHPTTYTAGVRFNENEILDKKIKIIKTNRGGKVTLHNPGQKIVYFVIDLNKRKKDIRKLINKIEESIIDFLKIYKIEAREDKKNIGIWVKNKKIAAIGVKIKKWVAYHGCSININNNLDEYFKIIPCGLNNKNITSLIREKKGKIYKVNENLRSVFLKKLFII